MPSSELRYLQSLEFRHGAPDDSLKIAIHPGGSSHQQFQATLPLGPGPREGALFSFEVLLHRDARLNDGRHPTAKKWTGQVLVHALHLSLATLR